ncbi:MAG: hypothetical protein U1C46_05650, partial [Bacteroidales bacterium]|nr:hypothetical protein [Bacteroidales bacterium]
MKNIEKHFCFISPAGFPLFVSGGVGPGGAERQFLLYAETILIVGGKVSFITEPPQKKYDDELDKRFKIITTPIFRHGSNHIVFLFNIFRFCIALKKVDADFYIIKLPSFLLLPMGLYSKLFRKKLVFWGQMSFDSNPDLRKQGMLGSFITRIGISLADIVIAQTDE